MTGINKIIITGDEATGKRYIGEAHSQMNILLNQMSFQNLSQGVRVVSPYKGVTIRCIKIFNYQECRINAGRLVIDNIYIENPEIIILSDASCEVPTSIGYILIKFTPTYGTGYHIETCIIWNLAINDHADDVPLNDEAGIASFPIETSEISDWLDERISVGSPAVTVVNDKNYNLPVYANVPSVSCTPITEPVGFSCAGSNSDSLPVAGIDYLGNSGQSADKVTTKNYIEATGGGTQEYDEIKTYDTPIRAYMADGKLITSNTTLGGTRARTASGLSTDSQEDLTNPWGRNVLKRVESVGYEYEFKSPFADGGIQTCDHLSGDFIESDLDAGTCDIHSDSEVFKDQMYGVGSIMLGDKMVLFYMEEAIGVHGENICADAHDMSPVYCNGVGYEYEFCSFPLPPYVITYFSDFDFKIKAFSQIGSGVATGINPFELPEDSALTSALEGLKTYAETFSGTAGEDECSRLTYSINIV